MKKLFLLFVLSISSILSGEILMYEGFSSSDYDLSKSINNKKGAVKSIGLDTTAGWNSGTGVFIAQEPSLELLSSWTGVDSITGTEDLRAVIVNGAVGTSARKNRAQQRKLDLEWPSSGSVYFRFLMQVDKNLLTTQFLGNNNYWLAGLGTEAITSPVGDNCNIANGLYMGVRNNNGTFYVSAYFRDPTTGEIYPPTNLFAIDTSKNLNCVLIAKIDIGENGSDTLSFYAAPVDSYDIYFDWTTVYENVSLISRTTPLSYLQMIGQYCTNNKWVSFDEFVITTNEAEAYHHKVKTAPVISDVALTFAEEEYTVEGFLSIADANLSCILYDGTIAVTNSIGACSKDSSVSASFTTPMDNKTYRVSLYAENSLGEYFEVSLGTIYGGALSIVKTQDAAEAQLEKGMITVSRANADPFPLTVNYSFADGTARADVNYLDDSGVVVIPAGEASVTIFVSPIVEAENENDTALTVSLDSGNYFVNNSAIEVIVKNFTTPMGYNYWIGVTATDGAYLASTASNWSKGVVPTASEIVVFDPDFTANSCKWDSAAPQTVAGWEQKSGYNGTVTFMTTYPGQGFETFNITGDVTIEGGTWTHNENTNTEMYRLSVSVGGSFSLGSAAKLDAQKKGYQKNSYPTGGAAGVHGGGYGSVSKVYGNVYKPISLGAGNSTTAGGGAIFLDIEGSAEINGIVRADTGENTSGWLKESYGAGGSIYIEAASVVGSGKINASALETAYTSKPGSGGRIAITLTSATELGLPIANITANGTDATANGGSGAGTILIKTANQRYGSLYVKNIARKAVYEHYFPTPCGTTLIPSGENWIFDEIVFSGYGILGIPEGTTLTLPNGFASVRGSGRTAGILYDGGVIDAADEENVVIQNKWLFQAIKPYTFIGNVTVTNGAAIGCLRLLSTVAEPRICDVIVKGNMLVGADSSLFANYSGLTDNTDHTRFNGFYSHGGQLTIQTNSVYGSILSPVLPGVPGAHDDSASQFIGGGVVKLVVEGCLTLDGKAVSTGDGSPNSYEGVGSGGSINITAGSLEGEGSISVIGSYCGANLSSVTSVSGLAGRNVKTCTGGGRVSVRLTDDDAEFSEHWMTSNAIKAYGGSKAATGAQTNALASAGTVYLQSGSDKEGSGTIFVRNNNLTSTPAKTAIPSTKHNNDESLKSASLSISEAGRVIIVADVQLENVDVAKKCTLDIAGRTLKVRSMELDGVKLGAGQYTAKELNDAGHSVVVDSSEAASGVIDVLGSALIIIVR